MSSKQDIADKFFMAAAGISAAIGAITLFVGALPIAGGALAVTAFAGLAMACNNIISHGPDSLKRYYAGIGTTVVAGCSAAAILLSIPVLGI